MYASVRHYRMGAGSIDSLMHRVDAEFAPAITQGTRLCGLLRARGKRPNVGGDQHLSRQGIRGTVQRTCCGLCGEKLDEFELTRTEVSGGEVLVSRVTAEALEDADRWAHGIRSRRHSP
jgi:hypothetical protein